MVLRNFLLLMSFALASTSNAAITGRQVMEKQKNLHKVKTETELQKMVLVDKDGSKEPRELKRYSKEVGKDQYRSLLVFLSPPDIRGTALLTWQNNDRPDDQWLYLPAQKKMQRIASGSKKNYFMGTDFTYEDLEPEKLDDNKYKVLREEKFKGKDCFVVEAIPASKEKARSSGYKKRVLWVTKDTFVTLKTEFYDRRDKMLKVQENRDWTNVQKSIWRAKKGLMDNHKLKHQTLVGSVDRKTNKPIEDSVFTERHILKGLHTK